MIFWGSLKKLQSIKTFLFYFIFCSEGYYRQSLCHLLRLTLFVCIMWTAYFIFDNLQIPLIDLKIWFYIYRWKKRCEIASQRLFPAFEHSQKSNCFFAPQESSKIKNGLNNAEIYLYDARMINSYASSTFMRTKKKPSLPLFTTKSSLFHGYCPFK